MVSFSKLPILGEKKGNKNLKRRRMWFHFMEMGQPVWKALPGLIGKNMQNVQKGEKYGFILSKTVRIGMKQ